MEPQTKIRVSMKTVRLAYSRDYACRTRRARTNTLARGEVPKIIENLSIMRASFLLLTEVVQGYHRLWAVVSSMNHMKKTD